MKKILLSSLVAAAAAVPAVAGVNNINYQAVIKNGNSVVVDQQVNLKFELLDNADKVVFSEVQTPKTNGAGYVACQLGQENDLSELNWGDLKLRVSIDLGSGYQVYSTEEVSSVPTALYALKSADSDMIIDAVEGMMVDVETNKTSILGINAELVKFDGFIEETEGQLENLNNVAAVVRANEEAIEELQGDFKNLGENLDKAFEQMTAQFGDVDGQLENLNNVSAVVRANEEAIEELQGDFKNLGENLDNAFNEMEARFAEVNGQLENLNHVSAVVRVNEEAIEELTPEVEKLIQANEETQAKLNAFGADIARIEGIAEEVEAVKESIDNFNSVSAVVLANQKGIAENKADIAEVSQNLNNLGENFEMLGGQLEYLFDMFETVQALQRQVEALEAKVDALGK